MATCKDCFHWNACKKMLEAMWGHCVPSGYEGGADRCEDFINTADVAPRSEVAREIFKDLDEIAETDGCVYYLYSTELTELEKKYTEDK